MTTKSNLLASASVALVLPFYVAPALAQEVDLGTLELESLRKLDVDTATPITTLDQEELDSRQASTLAEAVGTIPGVTLSNAATPQGSSINIRGLGADAGTYGSNTKVSVVVDGVAKGQEELYRQGSLLSMEPELFKQVSVIRGPAESFRFSSGAIGGTVVAETKDAADFLEDGDTFAFRQKLAFKSNSNERMSTSILAWAPTDRLDVIGFYGYREADDYTDGDGNKLADTAFKMPSGLVKLKYKLTDDLSVVGSYSKSTNVLRDVSYDFIGSSFSARVDADVEDVTSYVGLNYNPVDNDLVDITAKFTYSDELIENVSSSTSSTIYNADNRTKRKTFILENNAFFQTGGISHNVLAGLEIGERERTSVSHTGSNAGASPGGKDKFTAVYLTNEMEIGNLTVTPQLRYEWQSLTGSDNGLATDGQKFKSSDWSGALAVRYGFDNGVGVFGTVAYNTNLPILDDLSSATKIGVTEKATTYEAGLSYSGIGVFSEEDKLDGKVTLFRTNVWNNTTYTNPLDSTSTQTYLAANPSNPFAGITPDSDQMNLQGVELELSYVHTEFYADFNASRVRAEWGDGTWFNNAPADVAQLTLGKRFMDEQLDLSLEIKHAWATNRNVNRSFGATGVTNVFAEQHKSHTTYDLNFAYVPTSGALEGFEVRGGVDNVTDVAYQPYLSSRAARGRTFKLSVAKVF